MIRFRPGMPAEFQRTVRHPLRPILPRSGLYYVSHVDGREVADRFAEQFAATWRRIPIGARRRVLHYWRTFDFGIVPLMAIPTIELSPCWATRQNGTIIKQPLGFCTAIGTMLRFWEPAVRLLPDDHLHTLIAHELGHVFLKAVGQNDPSYGSKSEADNAFGEEIDVYETIMDWGFDDDALDAWVRSDAPEAIKLRRLQTELDDDG